ncbi:MAG: long-chain fatty acid--CoA ligase [Planctomycetota bacterium]|nr:MAG: long-chain fatty acid--CoA ligase [Planctomycetota bacterium]
MDTSPLPILDAAERYGGRFVDLDRELVIEAAGFHAGRQALATRLTAWGLAPGARVVVSVSNGPQFVATLVSILAAGGSPLLVHAKTPATELKRTALRFGAEFIVADECPVGDFEAESLPSTTLEAADWLQLSAGRVDSGTPGFHGEFAALPGVPLHPTSGTTGVPKVAVRPGFAATEEARHYIETLGVTSDDTIMAVAPMCHAYAYGMCVMVPLLSGAAVVSMRGFQAGKVFQGLAQEPVTILPAVPAMLDVLLFGAGDRLRGTVRTVLSAGSPLSERTAERFHARSGATIRPLYGTTETGGITIAPAGEQQIAGSCVGPPMEGVEAQVRPHPEHSDAQPGVGRLFIRSSSMMSGYLASDGVDTSPVVDGWFETGDLARIDEHGYIHLLGREADVINVEGLKVIPSEVEEVIAAIPGVVEVKVYAGARKSGGQFIKAAVVAESALDVQTIRAHCEKHLVYYKRPERIHPLDALPRSPAGKIQRDKLP